MFSNNSNEYYKEVFNIYKCRITKLQNSAASSAIIFPILAILLIPVGLAFAELTAMLPFASSVDIWATSAFGHRTGWIAQWMMFLIQVVEPPMMAFIFITAINFFIPIPSNMVVWVAIGIVLLWYILSNFNIGLTGKLATIFFFAMGGMAPWGEVSGMNMPEPELVANLGLPSIIGIAAITAGILHAFTTLMGFWTSSARVLYGAAQLNQLPKAFMKLNKYG